MAKTKTVNTCKLVTSPENCFREENTLKWFISCIFIGRIYIFIKPPNAQTTYTFVYFIIHIVTRRADIPIWYQLPEFGAIEPKCNTVKTKVKFAIEQVTKAQRECRGIALLFL
jgi:hypothetical protein